MVCVGRTENEYLALQATMTMTMTMSAGPSRSILLVQCAVFSLSLHTAEAEKVNETDRHHSSRRAVYVKDKPGLM